MSNITISSGVGLKMFHEEKRKPSLTFLPLLDEKWEGAKFRRIERMGKR